MLAWKIFMLAQKIDDSLKNIHAGSKNWWQAEKNWCWLEKLMTAWKIDASTKNSGYHEYSGLQMKTLLLVKRVKGLKYDHLLLLCMYKAWVGQNLPSQKLFSQGLNTHKWHIFRKVLSMCIAWRHLEFETIRHAGEKLEKLRFLPPLFNELRSAPYFLGWVKFREMATQRRKK